VPETATLDEVVEVFRKSTYTRLPVYADTLDSPVGLVHLKDVALKFGFDGEHDAFDLSSILRPLIYVPPSMPVGVLLQKMQTERMHMALVIDEYGGVDGLVTIEDLVEQIVGEIADEHDAEEDIHWIEEGPGVYLCSARAPMDEFEALAGVDLLPDAADEDVDTLGGLVFMLAGRVPLRGELIPHPDGHEFEVVDADARRIKRLRVRARPGPHRDAAAEAAE
jgi:magnesium and cobalt transporter